jgi:hypothetical protein
MQKGQNIEDKAAVRSAVNTDRDAQQPHLLLFYLSSFFYFVFFLYSLKPYLFSII